MVAPVSAPIVHSLLSSRFHSAVSPLALLPERGRPSVRPFDRARQPTGFFHQALSASARRRRWLPPSHEPSGSHLVSSVTGYAYTHDCTRAHCGQWLTIYKRGFVYRDGDGPGYRFVRQE